MFSNSFRDSRVTKILFGNSAISPVGSMMASSLTLSSDTCTPGDSVSAAASIGVASILGFNHMQPYNRPMFPIVGLASPLSSFAIYAWDVPASAANAD